jgi:hypothetical protein
MKAKLASTALAALLAVAASGCTKKNPAYCDATSDCPAGDVCDVSAHACTPADSTDASTAGGDATPPECDVNKPFAPATEVPGIHDPLANDAHATLTSDELNMYFASNRFDYSTTTHVFRAHRTSRDGSFESPKVIPGIWDTTSEGSPAISSDETTLYCEAYKMNTNMLLVMSKRSDATVAFPSPTTISDQGLAEPSITSDEKTLYVSNQQTGNLARLQNTGGTFGAAEDLALQASVTQVSPATGDGLTLFMTLRNGPVNVTKRASTQDPWPVPSEVTELGSHDELFLPSWVSSDGCRLYLTYAPSGGKSRIYMAARPK